MSIGAGSGSDYSVGKGCIVDTHAHVFASHLRLADGRRYTPGYEASLEHYLGMLDSHGIASGVLVQPSFLGTDNAFMLDAIARAPTRLKGVAVVAEDVTDEELDTLQAQGIVGARLNGFGQPLLDISSPSARRFWRRLATRGWHVEVHKEARDLERLVGALLAEGLEVIVDHFGRPEAERGTHDPGFMALLALASTQRVWVKISAAYRCVSSAGDHATERRFASDATRRLLHHFGPQRCVWGSDWPHTQHERSQTYSDAVTTLQSLDLDAAERKAITCTTPRSFYRFGETLSA